jgi:hypothetical protein
VKINPDGAMLGFAVSENGFVSFDVPGFETFANIQVITG